MSQPGNGVNGNGNGAGHEGEGIPQNARRLDRRVVRPNYLPARMNPEQGCYGCLISVGVVAVTVLIWVFIYWYNEPNFHRPDEDASPPPPAQTLRRPRPDAKPP
ncbi:MAG: hypothetical protein H7Z41_11645 [Cytophagales bacterium]|nr:hypothetical protein [Armatimonadota bacterium]